MTSVKIKVNFYDQTQSDLVKEHFPIDYALIAPIDDSLIDVPLEDFQTYSFFRHQYDHDGLRTFFDLSKLSKNWDEYYIYFRFNELTGHLTNKFPGRIDGAQIPEALGVAGGLSVASHIHGLTQADWCNIGIQKNKDFDFRHLACTNELYINIEAKGSINENNALKSSSVSQHKTNILGKKSDKKFSAKYDYSKDSCLGIITVADRNNHLQSWVVDPVFETQSMSPRKIKLLKRLYFYHSIIKLISKRSYITITLANRIKVIEQISDFESLNKIPLVNFNFEKIRLNDGFINSRASNKDKTIIGRSIIIRNKELFFIGIPTSFFSTIISQDIEDIFGMANQTQTSSQTINCKIKNSGEIETVLRRNDIALNVSKDGNDLSFIISMNVIQNSAGLCIARFPLK